MADVNKVTSLRYQLKDALGNNADKYFDNLKQWFRMKMSKEDFDYSARKLFTNTESSYLHNKFLFELLNRCQIIASHVAPNQNPYTPVVMTMTPSTSTSRSPREHKSRSEERRKKARPRDKGAFEPVEIIDHVPSPTPGAPPITHISPDSPVKAAPQHQAFLPDSGVLLGRLLLAGWDCGLEGAEDSAADLVATALQHFIKNVLTSVFQMRSGYRLRDNKFIYAMGNPVPNPYLKNTSLLKRMKISDYEQEDESRLKCRLDPDEKMPLENIDVAEQKAAYELACATSERGRPLTAKAPVSLFDLYDALKVQRCTIKSHIVYIMMMEKIVARMNHPSREEQAAASIAT